MSLGDGKGSFLVYSDSAIESKDFSARWINPKTGKVSDQPPSSGPFVVWLTKK
jgi:hypothetical protein